MLLLGAGETAVAVARCLVERGARELAVANRSQERAEAFVREFPSARLVPFDARRTALDRADLVVAATSAAGADPASRGRRGRDAAAQEPPAPDRRSRSAARRRGGGGRARQRVPPRRRLARAAHRAQPQAPARRGAEGVADRRRGARAVADLVRRSRGRAGGGAAPSPRRRDPRRARSRCGAIASRRTSTTSSRA